MLQCLGLQDFSGIHKHVTSLSFSNTICFLTVFLIMEGADIIPPFAEKLCVDEKLSYSNKDFKKIIESIVTEQKVIVTEKLKQPPFPSQYLLAQFSSKVYLNYENQETDSNYEKRLHLDAIDSGWKLLTTSNNPSFTNGYFGAAFWNPTMGQVVISHRGTDVKDLRALYTDYKGIFRNEYVNQMNSACTFTDNICTVINKYALQISITGHSLGGWLAQIATFSTKYLNIENGYFLKSRSSYANYHCHTVVFDSPGCKTMLLKMEKDFDVLYHGHSISLNSLDITSYLSAPNLINTCNLHLGNIYRIYVDLSDKSKMNEKTYNQETHRMDRILKVFDEKTGKVFRHDNQFKMKEVVDWPIGVSLRFGGEYRAFFKWANELNAYDPEVTSIEFQKELIKKQHRFPIRYQTKMYEENYCSINILSELELTFLKGWKALKDTKTNLGKIKDILQEINIDFNNVLPDFEIIAKGKLQIISCKFGESLDQVIRHAKQLLRWCPDIADIMKEEISLTPMVYELMYQIESNSYCKGLIEVNHNFQDNIQLTQFLVSQEEQVLHLITEDDTGFEAARLYNIFSQIKRGHSGKTRDKSSDLYTSDKHHTFLHWGQVLSLAQMIDIIGVFKSISQVDNLLVIEYPPSEEFDEIVSTLFQNLFNCLNVDNFKKIVIISQIHSEFSKFFMELRTTTLEFKLNELQISRIKFSDLTNESQQELLLEKNILFQEQEKLNLLDITGFKLDDLIDKNLKNISDLIDSRTLKELITKKQSVKIGNKPICLSDMEFSYAKIYKEIPGKSFVDALVSDESTVDLFVVTGILQDHIDGKTILLQLLKIENDILKEHVKSAIERKVVFLKAKDADVILKKFKKICVQNRMKRIYLIEICNNRVGLQQVYDSQFYVKREFNQIIIHKSIKNFLVQNQLSDILIFSNVSDCDILMDLLEVNVEKERNIFLKNIKDSKIRILSSDESALDVFHKLDQKNSKKSAHWIIFKFNKLVWHCSLGSLDGIRPYIDKNMVQEFSLEEKTFTEFTNRVHVIADEPGMGKSTTLISLANQFNSAWVIHIDLKDCQEELDNLSFEDPAMKEIIQFISNVDKSRTLSNPLAKGLLKYCLQNNTSKRIYLLLDGFDEMKQGNIKTDESFKAVDQRPQQKLIRILQYLKESTKSTIWITTREYKKIKLENALCVFARTLTKFNQLKQIKFLTQFWKIHLSLQLVKFGYAEEGKCVEYAKKMLTEAENILGKEICDLLGNPLQLKMLAEIFQPGVDFFNAHIRNDSIIPIHSLTDLYDKFVDSKYLIYFKEKTGLSSSLSEASKLWLTAALRKRYQNLAFSLLFRNIYNQYLSSSFLSPKEFHEVTVYDEMLELNRVGIIQSIHGDDRFEFIHRTFAEYFAADLLFSWLQKSEGRHQKYPPLEEFLLLQLFLRKENKVIRIFFNGQLVKHELPVEARNFYRQKIPIAWRRKHIFNEEDHRVLHVLVEENHLKIIEFLLACFQSNPTDLESLIVYADKNGKTAVHTAAEFGNNEALTLLIENGSNVNAKDKDGIGLDYFTPLHYAALKNHKSVIETLLRSGAEINSQDRNRMSPLEQAAKAGNIKCVQCLVDSGADIKAVDNYKMTALHWAAKAGNLDVVKLLITKCSDLKNASDKYGMTPLHHAAKASKWKIVIYLVDEGADPNVLDKNKATPFNWVIDAGKWDVVIYLLGKGADVSKLTPAQLAIVDKNSAKLVTN